MSLRMLNDVLKLRDMNAYCPLCGCAFAKVNTTDEHIFPRWLQHYHNLWNRTLSLPNFVGRKYKSIKVKLCAVCNNVRFGQLETCISRLVCTDDPYSALQDLDIDDLAIWLGKIFWLLSRKSHASVDPTTRNQTVPGTIISTEIMRGTTYVGIVERAFAMKRGIYACHLGDPPFPEFFYGAPYSIYRFKIDTRDERAELFDFKDNTAVLGVALRTGNFGVVCLFDGGLHAHFRSHWLGIIGENAVHPVQFKEIAARIFYDQTVLCEDAQRVQYFWNRNLNSVIAMTMTRRTQNPYLQENHNTNDCAEFLARFCGTEKSVFLARDGNTLLSTLVNKRGKFWQYPFENSRART